MLGKSACAASNPSDLPLVPPSSQRSTSNWLSGKSHGQPPASWSDPLSATVDYQIWPVNGFSREIRMMKSGSATGSETITGPSGTAGRRSMVSDMSSGGASLLPGGSELLATHSGISFYEVKGGEGTGGHGEHANAGNGTGRRQGDRRALSTGYPYDDILFAPYNYLLQTPGKGIRSAILDAFNEWLHVPEPKIKIIKSVVEMLHSGSLLIDDIEDNSELRRGVPTAHKIYGMAQTINSANYVYFAALQMVQRLRLDSGEPGAGVQIYTEELLNAHRGQGMEIFWRENCICPSETQYLEMVENKTACLMRLGIGLMVAYRGPTARVQDSPPQSAMDPPTDLRRSEPETPDLPTTTAKRMCLTNGHSASSPTSADDGSPLLPSDYIELCTILGSLFQIRDDYINLCSTKFAQTKGFCEDLTEGKYSFPVIHHLHNAPSVDERQRLQNILRQRTTDENLKQYALRLMAESGSFAYTKSYLMRLEDVAMKMIKRIARRSVTGNEKLEGILALLRRDYMEGSAE